MEINETLEQLAEQSVISGRDAIGDPDIARIRFSFAHEIYKKIKPEKCKECHELMMKTGLSEEGARVYEEKYKEHFKFVYAVVEKLIDKIII